MKKKIFLMSLIICATSYANDFYFSKNEVKLEDTVITTTGFGEAKQNQINNITVLTSEDIESKNYKNIVEILEKIPGISIEKNVFGNRIDMRGQGSGRSIANVKILLDGVNLNPMVTSHAAMPLESIDINSIERIEIIPSGGSILYGGGTTGGVINIISKNNKGSQGVSASLGMELGSYGTKLYRGSLAYNFNDKLTINTSYNKTESDTYRKHGKLDNEYFDFSAFYNLSERQNINFKFTNSKSDNLNPPNLSEEQIKNDRRGKNIKLEDVSSLKRERKEYSINYSNILSENLKFNLNSSISTFDLISETPSKDEQFSVKPKFSYDYGQGSIYFGYDYADNDYERITRTNTLKSNKLSQGIYLYNRHEINKFQISTGIRYEKAEFNLERFEPTKGKIYDYKRNTDDKAYMLGLNYLYSNSGKVYIRYEQGFVIPGSNQLIDKNLAVDSGYRVNDLKNENFVTMELGFEDYIGNTNFRGAVFYTKTTEEIAIEHRGRMGRPDHEWDYFNIDETIRKGIDLSASHTFGKLSISESISMIDARVASGDNKDNFVPGVYPVSANIDIRYQITNALDIGLNLNYKDKYYLNVDNSSGLVNDRTISNLVINYNMLNGLKLYAGINNLNDKKYYDNLSYNSRTDVFTYDPAAERNYYIGFKYNI